MPVSVPVPPSTMNAMNAFNPTNNATYNQINSINSINESSANIGHTYTNNNSTNNPIRNNFQCNFGNMNMMNNNSYSTTNSNCNNNDFGSFVNTQNININNNNTNTNIYKSMFLKPITRPETNISQTEISPTNILSSPSISLHSNNINQWISLSEIALTIDFTIGILFLFIF